MGAVNKYSLSGTFGKNVLLRNIEKEKGKQTAQQVAGLSADELQKLFPDIAKKAQQDSGSIFGNNTLNTAASTEGNDVTLEDSTDAIESIRAEEEAMSEIDYSQLDSEVSSTIAKANIGKYNDVDKLLKDMYNDKDVLAIIAGSDGKLSKDEREKFENYIKYVNGGKDQLELNDLQKTLTQIKDGEFNIEDFENFDLDSLKALNKANSVNEAGAAGGPDGPDGSDPSYFPSDDGLPKDDSSTSLDGKSVDELQTMKAEKQDKIQQTSSTLKNIQNNSDPEISAKKAETDKKEEDYLKQLENDEKVSEELKEKEKQVLENISNTEESINNTNTQITDCETQITTLESSKASVEATNAQLTAQVGMYEAQKSQLQDSLSSISEDDEDAEDTRKAIEEKIRALDEQIQATNSQIETNNETIASYEEQIAAQNAQLETLQGQLEEFQAQLEAYQEEKDVIENGDGEHPGIKDTCSEETKKALEDFNQSKKEFDQFKQEKIDETKSKLDNLKTGKNGLQAIDKKLIEAKAQEGAKGAKDSFTKDFFEKLSDKDKKIIKKYNPEIYKELDAMYSAKGEGKYSKDAGDMLAKFALERFKNTVGDHHCMGGVASILLNACGIQPNIYAARQFTNALTTGGTDSQNCKELSKYFSTDGKVYSAGDLSSLPKGCIVVADAWGGNPYGHTFITTGNGKAVSDHRETLCTYDTSYHVFYPTDDFYGLMKQHNSSKT